METEEIFSFLPLINNSVTMRLRFLITKQMNNHIIKSNQYFTFFLCILFCLFVCFVLIKTLESFKCFNPVLSLFQN